MSISNIQFNYFIKSFSNDKIPIQKDYKIYQFFKKSGQKVNIVEFFINVCVYSTNFKNSKSSRILLNFFYLVKSPKTFNVFFNKRSFLEMKYTELQFVTFENNPHQLLNFLKNFWKKFKKLKRPKTEDNYNEFFLKSWKKKLSIYNTLGFTFIQDSVYLVRCKSELFYKNLVSLNKALIISPKLQSSSFYKFFNQNYLNNLECQFLRKNKVYNKGRYSRCRQNYRTGVYMCMYLSIISIFGLYYWFYKFSCNFTYLWWLFIAFTGSFFLPKIIKYRLYEPINFLTKVFSFVKWFFLVCRSFF